MAPRLKESHVEFASVILARRSVRQYRPDPVPREVLQQVVAAGIEAPSGANLQLRQYVIVDDPAVLKELGGVSRAMTGAPAAIVLLVEPQETTWGEFWIQDASAAIENMLLAAVDLGYASCWIEGQVHPNEPGLRTLLGVPEALRVWAILPIGKPAGESKRPPKSVPQEVTHYNRFGVRK